MEVPDEGKETVVIRCLITPEEVTKVNTLIELGPLVAEVQGGKGELDHLVGKRMNDIVPELRSRGWRLESSSAQTELWGNVSEQIYRYRRIQE